MTTQELNTVLDAKINKALLSKLQTKALSLRSKTIFFENGDFEILEEDKYFQFWSEVATSLDEYLLGFKDDKGKRVKGSERKNNTLRDAILVILEIKSNGYRKDIIIPNEILKILK